MEDDDVNIDALYQETDISIHVLRMEDDKAPTTQQQSTPNFNPRPPHGGRQRMIDAVKEWTEFQSTSSAWRTTVRK